VANGQESLCSKRSDTSPARWFSATTAPPTAVSWRVGRLLAALLLALTTAAAGAEADRPVGTAAGPLRRGGALSPERLRGVTARLMAFGPRAVGGQGHAHAASYVGGRLLLAGLKPILTDTFACRVPGGGGATPEDGRSARRVVCGSVVAFAHALPLADAWSLMKGQAEDFTFDHPPGPDLEAALRQAARDEGVARLVPFDVFKRPSALFPRAVVRCLLRRMVRGRAGAEAGDPRARAAVMAGMLRDLARAHEAVLLAAPLDMRPAPGAGAHGADESASLAVLCALAEYVACESPRPRTRTLICAALDGHWHGAAGARSLARMLGERCQAPLSSGTAKVPDTDAETAEDAQLAALLGQSEAAARAPALAEAIEARPADPAAVAEAEDVLVRLLRMEPYAVRLVLCLDLASDGRRVTMHVADAAGEAGAGLRRWLSAAAERAKERCQASFSIDTKKVSDTGPAPDTASGRAWAALAAPGRPAVLLRTAGADRGRWFTAEDTPERMDFAALSDQAKAVAAMLSEVLAAEAPPGAARDSF